MKRSNAPILWCAILLAVSAFPARALTLAGPVVNPANDHLYYLLSPDTWTASEAAAVALGSHLVTINDAAENAWVSDTFSLYLGTPRELWIGFTDQSSEGNFVWTSGEPVTYTNWHPVQPDNTDGFTGEPEHYTHMASPVSTFGAGRWNDLRDIGYDDIYGVVEVVPEPSTYVLLVAGVMFCLALRRHGRSRSLGCTGRDDF